MLDFIISEYLILALLLPVVSRFFFIKTTTLDIFSVLSPTSVVVSLLQIIAYGLNLSTLILFLLTLFVFFTNIRCFARFCTGLYIDWFGALYRFFSVLQLLIIIFTVFAVFYFRPIQKHQNNVVQEITYFSGTPFRGYTKLSSYFQQPDMTLHFYSPITPDFSKPPILYIQDPRTTISDCDETIKSIASRGFIVYAAEFSSSIYSKYIPFLLRLTSYFFPSLFINSYNTQILVYQENTATLLSTITKIHGDLLPDGYIVPKFFIVSDGLGERVAESSANTYPNFINSYYQINFSQSDENGLFDKKTTPPYIDGYANIPLLHPEEFFLLTKKKNMAVAGIPKLIAAEIETAISTKYTTTAANKNSD